MNQLKKASEPIYKSPKSVQQVIDIQSLSKSGVFYLGNNRYSKSYVFFDVNYVTEDEETQIDIFERYCSFLNQLDVEVKITINNKNRNMDKLQENILFADKEDGFDSYRHIYNNIIFERIQEGKQGIEQQKYLTITVSRKNYEEAKAQFHTIEASVKQAFINLGSYLIPLDCTERLRVLHDFYNIGLEEEYSFDYDNHKKMIADFRNDVCAKKMKVYPNHMEMNDKLCKAMFIKKYPASLSDRFLSELTNLPVHSITSIDITPVPKEVTTDIMKKKYLGVENDIIKQQQKRNKNLDFASDISYAKRTEKREIEAIMDDVRDNDQSLFLVAVTIVYLAEDKKEMESVSDTLTTIGKKYGCLIESHYQKQREALNTALPIGCRQVETMRTLLTQSLAVLMPFTVQELLENRGSYYGVNQVSGNIIVANRKRLINGGGFVFGVPGSGKSFFCKQDFGNVYLNTSDDLIIIDPQNEYFDIADTFKGQVVNLSTHTENYINPLEIPKEVINKGAFIADKGEFMLSVVEQCMTENLNSRQKSIIDRCIRLLYKKAFTKKSESPTMIDFYNILLKQKEQEAKDIALSLELFVHGSLNIFTHQTNINVQNRVLVYGLSDMGKELSTISMLIMMESISNRITENAEKGRATWLFMDEFHVLLDKEYTAKYLYAMWKKIRKQGGMPTGITQNISDLLQNDTATTMLSNSEFVVLLRQSVPDSKKLAEILGTSESQLKYVVNSPSGTGLIKCGNVIVPFDNRIAKDNELYKLFNTNLHEKSEYNLSA